MQLKRREKLIADRLPLATAIMWILLSVLFISGSMTLAWLYYLHLINLRGKDDAYQITMVIQKNSGVTRIPTPYFTELLDLSSDKSQNLYRFDVKDAKEKILSSPIIKNVEVKKIKPSTIYIDYIAREPVIIIADYENVAMDQEGYLFPFFSYYADKNLPSIYLGLAPFGEEGGGTWNLPLKNEKLEYAFECIDEWKNHAGVVPSSSTIKFDVSQAFAPSYGQRELVVKITDSGFEHLLRLDCSNLELGIKEYFSLLCYIHQTGKYGKESLIIDLRIPRLAYLSPFEQRNGK